MVCVDNADPEQFCTGDLPGGLIGRADLDVNIKPGDTYATVTGFARGGKSRTIHLAVNTGFNPRRCLEFSGTVRVGFEFYADDDCVGFGGTYIRPYKSSVTPTPSASPTMG